MHRYTFVQNVNILAGKGTIHALADAVSEAGYKKAMFIHGGSLKRSGVADMIQTMLIEKGVEVFDYVNVQPDPTLELVDEGAAFARENGCDCVVAVGGGSVIDLAKSINMLRFNDGKAIEYFKKPPVMGLGLFVAPTTAGTGAELTGGAVVTETSMNVKLPLPATKPELVVLDPELTVSMSPKLTMQTGLDAFSHAVEGYCNLASTIMMDPICEKIMEIIVEYLPKAVADGNDMEARTQMLSAACMSGWTLSTVLANVGHSLAHVVGASLHIVHGSACAYGLPPVLKHLAPAVPVKVRKIGQILGAEFDGTESPVEIGEKTAAAYISFRDSLGMPPVEVPKLSEEQLVGLAEMVVREPFAQLTPMPVDNVAALKLLKEMLAQ